MDTQHFDHELNQTVESLVEGWKRLFNHRYFDDNPLLSSLTESISASVCGYRFLRMQDLEACYAFTLSTGLPWNEEGLAHCEGEIMTRGLQQQYLDKKMHRIGVPEETLKTELKVELHVLCNDLCSPTTMLLIIRHRGDILKRAAKNEPLSSAENHFIHAWLEYVRECTKPGTNLDDLVYLCNNKEFDILKNPEFKSSPEYLKIACLRLDIHNEIIQRSDQPMDSHEERLASLWAEYLKVPKEDLRSTFAGFVENFRKP